MPTIAMGSSVTVLVVTWISSAPPRSSVSRCSASSFGVGWSNTSVADSARPDSAWIWLRRSTAVSESKPRSRNGTSGSMAPVPWWPRTSAAFSRTRVSSAPWRSYSGSLVSVCLSAGSAACFCCSKLLNSLLFCWKVFQSTFATTTFVRPLATALCNAAMAFWASRTGMPLILRCAVMLWSVVPCHGAYAMEVALRPRAFRCLANSSTSTLCAACCAWPRKPHVPATEPKTTNASSSRSPSCSSSSLSESIPPRWITAVTSSVSVPVVFRCCLSWSPIGPSAPTRRTCPVGVHGVAGSTRRRRGTNAPSSRKLTSLSCKGIAHVSVSVSTRIRPPQRSGCSSAATRPSPQTAGSLLTHHSGAVMSFAARAFRISNGLVSLVEMTPA